MQQADYTADDIVELLGLRPLHREGGMWAQTWKNEAGTAIYFLLRPGDPSVLHRLGGPELWHFYAGAPLQLVLVHPDGSMEVPVLDNSLRNGRRPMHAVEAGVWMGACTTGDWTLVGTTMAPPFDEASFELLTRRDALALCPEGADYIMTVTAPE